MDATASLARFTQDLRVGDLPAGAIDACARLALDTVGAAIPAWDAPGVRELRALLAQWGRGPCRVWIAGERLPPPAATLVNSAMAHALEYDDLHCELPIHSGVVVVPAVHTLDAGRRALADRIPVVLDDNLHGKWTARVAVRLRDGRAFDRTRDKAAGQSDAPLSTQEVRAKFEDSAAAAGPMLDGDAARRLADLLLDLSRLKHLAPLCDALAPSRPAARAS
jgi:2-methylcitrate dehydratase PrpD